MKKIWLLATTTYRQHIRSGTFLILTFGLPALMVVAGAAPILSRRGDDLSPTGYVDQTGRLALPSQVPLEKATLNLTAYSSPGQAQTALEQGHIAGYLVIPADYFEGQPPVFYGREEPGFRLEAALTEAMRRTMLAGQPAWLTNRLAEPSRVTHVARSTGQEVAEGPGELVLVLTPIALAIIFGLVVFTGAGQMGAAIVREKEQRAMEMVVTSLRPGELVAGKVLGVTLLTMTQMTLWAAGAGIGAGLALVAAGEQSLSLPWRAIIWAFLLGGPGYFLYAVLGAGLGVLAGGRQQARQLSGLLGFVGLAPLYFLGLLVNAVDSPLAIGLTWFPLTAPVVALFRMALTPVPTWQLLISLAGLLLSLMATVWFTARIFRAAMLLYGQALRPRQIWQALRQR